MHIGVPPQVIAQLCRQRSFSRVYYYGAVCGLISTEKKATSLRDDKTQRKAKLPLPLLEKSTIYISCTKNKLFLWVFDVIVLMFLFDQKTKPSVSIRTQYVCLLPTHGRDIIRALEEE